MRLDSKKQKNKNELSIISTCTGRFHPGYARMEGTEEYGKFLILAHVSPLMRNSSRDLEERVNCGTVGEGEISKALRSMLLAFKVFSSLIPLQTFIDMYACLESSGY